MEKAKGVVDYFKKALKDVDEAGKCKKSAEQMFREAQEQCGIKTDENLYWYAEFYKGYFEKQGIKCGEVWVADEAAKVEHKKKWASVRAARRKEKVKAGKQDAQAVKISAELLATLSSDDKVNLLMKLLGR